MGTIHTETILNKARKILNDAGASSWANQDLLDFYNTGQREVVKANNGTAATTKNLVCSLGTKQTITGLRLLSVSRNMGANGSTPGKPITKMNREMLDALIPEWHTLTAVDDALFYITGEDDSTFYLYPPIKANQQIEITEVTIPTDILLANISTADLAIDDIFEGAMIDYICARAFSISAELPGSAAKSQSHMQSFYASIGMDEAAAKIKADTEPGKK